MATAEDGPDVFEDGRLLKHGGYQPGPGTSHTDFLNFFRNETPSASDVAPSLSYRARFPDGSHPNVRR
jgi:hypothetical protein